MVSLQINRLGSGNTRRVVRKPDNRRRSNQFRCIQNPSHLLRMIGEWKRREVRRSVRMRPRRPFRSRQVVQGFCLCTPIRWSAPHKEEMLTKRDRSAVTRSRWHHRQSDTHHLQDRCHGPSRSGTLYATATVTCALVIHTSKVCLPCGNLKGVQAILNNGTQ